VESETAEQSFADALREALDSHFPKKEEKDVEEDTPAEKQPKTLRDAAEKARTVFRARRHERERDDLKETVKRARKAE
jgi:siroheme synthase (precorrin-2 oxidase/ferrochelatase)